MRASAVFTILCLAAEVALSVALPLPAMKFERAGWHPRSKVPAPGRPPEGYRFSRIRPGLPQTTIIPLSRKHARPRPTFQPPPGFTSPQIRPIRRPAQLPPPPPPANALPEHIISYYLKYPQPASNHFQPSFVKPPPGPARPHIPPRPISTLPTAPYTPPSSESGSTPGSTTAHTPRSLSSLPTIMDRELLEHIDQRINLAARAYVRELLTASMDDLD